MYTQMGEGEIAMRVGIMGGTLDPVHNGHLALARAAMEMLALDRVMLLPAGDPPHKLPPTHKTDRLQMARLAARTLAGTFACNVEIFRGGTTYTVDTLRELTRNNPNTRWYYLIGADTLETVESWRDFVQVAQMCEFAVVNRAEEEMDAACMRRLSERYGARFVSLPFSGPDISSSEIRRRVAQGRDVDGMVPPEVADYIREKGLYLCDQSKQAILDILKSSLKPARYVHTLGVAETARRLAARFGVEPCRAELAGLLHDCAKCLPEREMRALAAEANPPADALEQAAPNVMHAPAGSALAAQKFGVRDAEILSAIRKHTLGAEEMSAMDALIYTADFIEPNRKPFSGLEAARTLAETDIFRAMVRCAELTEEYIAGQGGQTHPRTLSMLASYDHLRSKEEET